MTKNSWNERLEKSLPLSSLLSLISMSLHFRERTSSSVSSSSSLVLSLSLFHIVTCITAITTHTTLFYFIPNRHTTIPIPIPTSDLHSCNPALIRPQFFTQIPSWKPFSSLRAFSAEIHPFEILFRSRYSNLRQRRLLPWFPTPNCPPLLWPSVPNNIPVSHLLFEFWDLCPLPLILQEHFYRCWFKPNRVFQ